MGALLTRLVVKHYHGQEGCDQMNKNHEYKAVCDKVFPLSPSNFENNSRRLNLGTTKNEHPTIESNSNRFRRMRNKAQEEHNKTQRAKQTRNAAAAKRKAPPRPCTMTDKEQKRYTYLRTWYQAELLIIPSPFTETEKKVNDTDLTTLAKKISVCPDIKEKIDKIIIPFARRLKSGKNFKPDRKLIDEAKKRIKIRRNAAVRNNEHNNSLLRTDKENKERKTAAAATKIQSVVRGKRNRQVATIRKANATKMKAIENKAHKIREEQLKRKQNAEAKEAGKKEAEFEERRREHEKNIKKLRNRRARREKTKNKTRRDLHGIREKQFTAEMEKAKTPDIRKSIALGHTERANKLARHAEQQQKVNALKNKQNNLNNEEGVLNITRRSGFISSANHKKSKLNILRRKQKIKAQKNRENRRLQLSSTATSNNISEYESAEAELKRMNDEEEKKEEGHKTTRRIGRKASSLFGNMPNLENKQTRKRTSSASTASGELTASGASSVSYNSEDPATPLPTSSDKPSKAVPSTGVGSRRVGRVGLTRRGRRGGGKKRTTQSAKCQAKTKNNTKCKNRITSKTKKYCYVHSKTKK